MRLLVTKICTLIRISHKCIKRNPLIRGEIVALSSATQHAMPPEIPKSGERTVLILGPLCLPCCVRDTA